jgi:hypothetical protein
MLTVLVVFLAVIFGIAEILDWIGRFELIERKWPKVWAAVNNRVARLILYVFLIVLVSKDISDRNKEHIPDLHIHFPSPPVPVIALTAPAPVMALAAHEGKSLPLAMVDKINSLSLELRVTCDLKEGAPLPPQEVSWMPLEGATAELRGNAATVPLQFNSPVIFRRQVTNEIVVINRFSLTADSDINGRPVSSLAGYTQVVVPIQTIVYGKSFIRARLAEASITINGRDMWYYQYKIDTPLSIDGKGLVISFPLSALVERLK